MLHENIGLPHRKHLYQIMANELKIPHMVVSLVYMLVQAVVIAGYLLFPGNEYGYLSGTIIVLSLVYILFMKRFFCLHQAKLYLRELFWIARHGFCHYYNILKYIIDL